MKKYRVLFESKARKKLLKLDKFDAKRLKKWIQYNLVGCSNPYVHGKPLKGNLSKYWRYRIGNYRLIAEIDDEKILILIVNIGHRRDVYYFDSSLEWIRGNLVSTKLPVLHPYKQKKSEKIVPIFSIRFSNDVDKKWIKLSKKKIYIIKREIKREKESIKKTRKFPRIDDFRELICFLHQFRLLLPNL